MGWRKSISKWTTGFAGIGILVPLLLMLQFFVFRRSFGSIESWLWPSSIMFMALDAPGTSRTTVSLVYAVAIAENAILYGVIGALTWLLVHVIERAVDRGHS
jgi:hypothetical protein